jgi:O-antigen ligase
MIDQFRPSQIIGVNAAEGRSLLQTPVEEGLGFSLRQLLLWPPTPAVLLLTALVVFSPLIDGGTTHVPVLVMRLILLAALAFWIFRCRKAETVAFPRTGVTPFLIALVTLAGFSLAWAPYKNPSLQWVISLLMYGVLFAVVLQGIQSWSQIWQVAVVMLAVGLFEGMLGIVQYAFQGEMRARGTFYNPNFFATYLVAGLSIILGILSGTPSENTGRRSAIVLWLAAAILAMAFILAQSRGAVLALLATLLFIGCLRFGKAFLIVILVGLLAGAVIPNPLKQRMVNVAAQDSYAYSRLYIWRSSLERAIDRPMGVGAGLYKYTSFQYRFPVESDVIRYEKRAESAHNEYLQIAVELGVCGLGLLLLGIGAWVKEAKPAWHRSWRTPEWGLIVGLSGVVCAILVHAAVDTVFHEPALMIVLVLSGGLVLKARSFQCPGPSWVVSRPFTTWRMTAVLSLIVTLAALSIQFAAGWYAHGRGQIEFEAGRLDQALEWFRLAGRIDAGTTGYHDDVAQVSLQLFHRSRDPQWLVNAAEEEEFAIALNPMDGRFPYRLGTIYEALAAQVATSSERDRLHAMAADAYQQAIKADPYAPMTFLALARIRSQSGHPEEGRSWVERALEVEPHFLPGRAVLVELDVKAGELEAARLQLKEIETIQKKFYGHTLSHTERQFLDIDVRSLMKQIALEPTP